MHGVPTRPISSLLLTTGLLLAVAACNNAESAGKPGGGGGEGGGGGAGDGPPAMPVEVAVARSDTVVDAILATGQVEAVQSIELRPDIRSEERRVGKECRL